MSVRLLPRLEAGAGDEVRRCEGMAAEARAREVLGEVRGHLGRTESGVPDADPEDRRVARPFVKKVPLGVDELLGRSQCSTVGVQVDEPRVPRLF